MFAAWATPEIKRRWFGCGDGWLLYEHTLDLRVGGHECWRVGPPGGTVHRNDAHYHDVVADRRLVFSYAMHLDDRLYSVSLASVELVPAGTGTRMIFREHVAFVDEPGAAAEREHGTQVLLDHLDVELGEPPRSS